MKLEYVAKMRTVIKCKESNTTNDRHFPNR